MNSPPLITSRANRRRALSLDNPATPLLGTIARRKSDKREQDEAAQRIHRMHVVSGCQCWSMYAVVALLSLAIVGIVFYAQRPNAFTPSLPDMHPGQTLPGQRTHHPPTTFAVLPEHVFNPHTAWEHLEAITTTPHPFNSRANSDRTRKYIQDQFRELQAEAIALGRRNVRYDDGLDNTTWTRRREERRTKVEGETGPDDGEELLPEEVLEVVQGDNMVMWVGGVVDSVEDNVPVSIEIDVDQESQTALLVSAHYDSVATSYGATDDGGGVAVALAMIRHFIHHPVQHTLIFNLNNAEELGLFGAAAFMGALPNSTMETGSGHPWKKYIRAFINLEGAGSGGPSLLFRASNYDIIRHYADNAPYPHASVFANDLFPLHLIRSDTDYSVYTQHGLLGLDIAFYQRRAMYHSLTDDLPIQSLYHMGSNAQATIAGLCNTPYLDSIQLVGNPAASHPASPSSSSSSEPFSPRAHFAGKGVFFDVLGNQMFIWELWTVLLSNTLFLGLGLPILTWSVVKIGVALMKKTRDRNHRLRSTVENPHSLRSILDPSSQSLAEYSEDGSAPLSPLNSSYRHRRRHSGSVEHDQYAPPGKRAIVKTVGYITLIIALNIGALWGASNWLQRVNPLARYSHPWLTLLALGWLLLVVNTVVVYSITLFEALVCGPVPVVRGTAQWTIALGLWWWLVVLVVGTGVAGWLGIGALYGSTVLAVCAGTAALVQIAFSFIPPAADAKSPRKIWVAVLVLNLLLPGVLILDLLVLVVHMVGHTFAGGNTGIMYVGYGVFLIPIFLSMVPVISRARNFKLALVLELLMLALLFWALTRVEPFTDQDPAGIHFSQYYNQTARTSYVELSTTAGPGYLNRILEHVAESETNEPSSASGKKRPQCSPVIADPTNERLESCRYQPARQVFEDPGRDVPVHAEWLSPKTESVEGWREGRLQILAVESRICSVSVDETSVGMETELWFEPSLGTPKEDENRERPPVNHHPKTLRVWAREWNRAWVAGIRVKEPSKQHHPYSFLKTNETVEDEGGVVSNSPKKTPTVSLKVVCGYDDWNSEQGYASEFNHLRTHIPKWTRIRDGGLNPEGLFTVGVDMHF
ncbi:hypothetical protein BGZ68_000696 [Mortierella alpina]|nr:hypothetical protein BGZ68_000696 [Mortierella alpina]